MDSNTKTLVLHLCAEAVVPGGTCRVSSSQLYLTKASDKKFAGIVNCMAGHDLDTAYTAATDRAQFFPAGSGQVVWAIADYASPAPSLVRGDLMHLSTNDSKLLMFAYSNATDTSDTHIDFAGRCESNAVTGSKTETKLIKLRLGL